ncbi:uncharacterized protein K02A2.6-like [Ylistrum balloti]|uniref:uncharacterized protein K02A2.6-like n=1 Tax=Ylistrum balloti TaxID=509963 RepID=UPI002905DAE1|nr:uncharacterized protein K02A2.6-like [Ylistrum balloti]
MAGKGIKNLPDFNPSEAGAPEWELYKRDFLIHLNALGLDDKPGRRKVGALLSNMGRDSVKIYDSFVWAPEVQPNEDAGIQARAAEDKHDLNTVFRKFDQHFGVHTYRNIKRQEFLNTKREAKSIMDFIATLKRKAEHCQYVEQTEGLICDMVINGVNDRKCSEKLMEIPVADLTLDKVIQTCRQVELTAAHLKNLGAENPNVNMVHRSRGRGSTRHKRDSERSYKGDHPYCKSCCRHHEYKQRPAYNKYCDNCGQKGHFKASSVCNQKFDRGRTNRRPYRGAGRGHRGTGRGHDRGSGNKKVHYTENQDASQDNISEIFDQCTVQDVFKTDVFNIKHHSDNDWKAHLDVNGQTLTVEIDSGARCNVLSKDSASKFLSDSQIEESDVIINGVSGRPLKACGMVTLPCAYKSVKRLVEFQILDTATRVNLLGREDCVQFGLIARVNEVELTMEGIFRSYDDVVGDQIGCIPGEYEIKIDKSITPVIHAPRPVPVILREQVKAELDNLQKCGIISPVEHPTEWVNSMVCVRKKNGRVRICIDPGDLNKAILREHYPMNSIDDIVTRVHGSKYFSTLDANMGYYQIKLSEQSSFLTTFNTPFGRYRYLRLPMGLKCAGEVFQREMITQFGNLDGVEVVVDDVLVHGKTIEEHNARLEKEKGPSTSN